MIVFEFPQRANSDLAKTTQRGCYNIVTREATGLDYKVETSEEEKGRAVGPPDQWGLCVTVSLYWVALSCLCLE